MHSSSFRSHVQSEIMPKLIKELDIKNPMQAPRLEKIVLNMGIGSLTTAKQDYKTFVSDLGLIAGQTPVIAYSRKSISNFKLREGMPVGSMVTLRGDAMYAFLEKLIAVVLPRVRDFRGISSKSFDQKGNFNFGIKEHTIFPEVPQLDVVKTHGMQVTFKFQSQGADHSKAYLDSL